MSKKICLLTDSLSSGGAEKVAANLSVSLSEKGYKITIVSMRNMVNYEYAGTLYNFALIKETNNKFNAFLKFKFFFCSNDFDVVIDHRVRSNFFKEFLFSKFIFAKKNVIYCIHSYQLKYYFSHLKLPKLSLFPHVKKAQFVSVCSEIQDLVNKKLNFKNIRIYNYVLSSQLIEKASVGEVHENDDYIISIGRLFPLKQFDVLISCYNKSNLSKENIKLKILGDGPEKTNLKMLISKLNLENYIELIPFKDNPYTLMQNAKCLVLSSKEEGFPMVLIESLTLKTPVIAFNCKSGPSEIIKHNINGLLVENQNQKALVEALNKLMLDKTFYKKIKENTQFGLNKFSENNSIEQWIHLIENGITDFKK